MQFERGKVYKHRNMRDVKMFIKAITNNVWSLGTYHVEVIWLTNSGTSMAIDKLHIYDSDIANWSEVTDGNP